ncbi:MAG TPA: hypothetical protein VFZ90_11305 [Gemmatimonadales bacterium]
MGRSVRELVVSVMEPGAETPLPLQAFPPLDVNQILSDLRLKQQAGKPDTADTTELDILDHIERLARKAHEVYLARVDHYEALIRSAMTRSDLRVQIEAAGSSALAEIRAQLLKHQNQLNRMLQVFRASDDQFRRFRQQHGITRPPKYVSLDKRRRLVLTLLTLVLLQAVLTTFLFADSLQTSLRDGMVQAVLLSILNGGIAALYARHGFPYLVHQRRPLQLVGVAATLLYVIALLRLSVAIAEVRDSSVSLAHRHLLTDDRSLILILLGCFVGLAAALNVAAAQDPYPGYAGVAAARQRAVQWYARKSAYSLAEILELRNRTVDDLRGALQLVGEAERNLVRAVVGRSSTHQEYVVYLQQLAGVHQNLVGRYRELNSRVREVQGSKDLLQPALRPMFAEPPSLAALRQEEDVRKEVIARIEHYIKAVNDEVDRALPLYLKVGELAGIEHAA